MGSFISLIVRKIDWCELKLERFKTAGLLEPVSECPLTKAA